MNRHEAIAALSNDALLAALHRVVGRERSAIAEVIAHLGEVDARRLYLDAAYSSMFVYCTEALHYSESAACKRIAAARAARRFPVILGLLESGALHLAGLSLLAQHLTPENHAALLGAVAHKSKRFIEQFLAGRAPKPDVPPSVRRIPTESATPAPTTPSQVVPAAPAPVSIPGPAPRPASSKVQPLSAERFLVRFTASAELHAMIEEASALLRHTIAPGDLPALFERALAWFIAELRKRKFGVGAKPAKGGSSRPGPKSRYVPRAERRNVYERDGGGCTFVDPRTGRRCNERAAIELDHRVAHALGGESTVENLTLRCKGHNGLGARRTFGDRHVDDAIARRRSAAPSPGTAGVGRQGCGTDGDAAPGPQTHDESQDAEECHES